MNATSALYTGRVVHARVRPRLHKLSYACYWLLLDLSEVGTLADRLRLFSHNAFNLFSLWDRDHGDGSGAGIDAQVRALVSEAGIDLAGGKIFLLTMPRILGYGFNPLSVYFCHTSDGALAALLYEVHNTFGQRHSYLIPVEGQSVANIEQRCAKRFYVSPFMEMDLTYDFNVLAPSEQTRISMQVSDAEGLVLTASLAGVRRALNDAALARIFFTHPLLTAKVIGAIHWEALRLWIKGVGLVPRPAPPAQPVTISNHRDLSGETS